MERTQGENIKKAKEWTARRWTAQGRALRVWPFPEQLNLAGSVLSFIYHNSRVWEDLVVMERRHNPRKQLYRRALLHHPRGFVCSCLIDNASSNGIFIRTTDERIYKGCCVDVAIDAVPYKAKPITAKGLVVHTTAEGIGLMCDGVIPYLELSDDSQDPTEAESEIKRRSI